MYRGKHGRSGLSLPWMQNMESEDCTWLSPGRTPRRKPRGSYRVSIRSTPYCISQKNIVPLHGGIIFLILRQEYAI